MNENDVNKQIADIRDSVEQINHRIGGGWTTLWRGILSGLGYVLGALIALIIIGWVLNVIGIIPAFKQQVNSLKDSLQQASSKPLQNH